MELSVGSLLSLKSYTLNTSVTVSSNKSIACVPVSAVGDDRTDPVANEPNKDIPMSRDGGGKSHHDVL